MMNVTKASLLSCILTASAMAGQEAAAPMMAAGASTPESNSPTSFDLCEFLSSKPGVIYKNDDNPWVSYVRILGRYHANFGYVEGRSNLKNGEWNESYYDNRRARLGWDAKFLKYFQTKGNINFVLDQNRSGGTTDWALEGLDEVYLFFDAKEAFEVEALDKLKLVYGRIKWHGGIESRMSSNNILTVERSAMSNYLYGAETGAFRPVGFVVNFAKGPLEFTAGIYSTGGQFGYREVSKAATHESKYFADWDRNYLLYNFEIEYKHSEELTLGYEFLYNDGVRPRVGKGPNENPITYDWAQTLSTDYNVGRAGVIAEVQYGDNGDWRSGQSTKLTSLRTAKNINGSFWGAMVMPYYWIVPSKLQAVVQVMHTASQGDAGISTNSRYVPAGQPRGTRASSGISGGGRGDDLTTVYTGLNYHLCGDNLKLQAGVEYTNLRTPGVGDGKVEALTYISGLRFNF